MRASTIFYLSKRTTFALRTVIRRPDTNQRDDDHEDVRRGAAADDRPAAGDPQQQEDDRECRRGQLHPAAGGAAGAHGEEVRARYQDHRGRGLLQPDQCK